MKGPPLGPVGEDITRPVQVAPGAERRLVPANSNLKPQTHLAGIPCWALRAAGLAGGYRGGSSLLCKGCLGLGALHLPATPPWSR